MKKINHIYKSACLFGLLAVGFASCNDYLTIYPTDRVVEENFWEDRNDLDGVRYGAYKQMATTVSNLILWGDLRSDSYKLNTEEDGEQTSLDMYNNILKGMPDSSMNIFDWGGVYKTINLCNKVLKHGPEVLDRDKQFTTTEWIYMRAEMKALRALNYFYLIRAFKDVPYTTKLINSDKDVESFPLTNQLIVLDSIILDCESVAGQARNRFSKDGDTKGMITNAAIYSMLADMYLWRASLHEGRNIKNDTVVVNKEDGVDSIPHSITADYELAASWADKALESHHNQVMEYVNNLGFSGTSNEIITFGLPNVDLVKNEFSGAHQSYTPRLESQSELFNTGNSIESIFEIQFSQECCENTIVNSLFGYAKKTHLMVAEDAIKEAHAGDDKNLKYDARMWIGCQNYINETQAKSGYYCLKYQNPSMDFEGSSASRKLRFAKVGDGDKYRNMIIYRTTDVMLMKAEALACLKKDKNTIMNIVNAINKRSYCDFNEGHQPNEQDVTADKYGNVKEASELSKADNNKITVPKIPANVVTVMNQRQLELIGEGKRWFDLVRMAERYSDNNNDPADERENPEGVEKGQPGYVGNGQTGMAALVYYFMKNSVGSQFCGTLYNRFKNRWGLYCPIYEQEVKASRGVVLQNPVWNKSRYEQ
jgi:hypothetical protein